jgi:hypothetical protein
MPDTACSRAGSVRLEATTLMLLGFVQQSGCPVTSRSHPCSRFHARTVALTFGPGAVVVGQPIAPGRCAPPPPRRGGRREAGTARFSVPAATTDNMLFTLRGLGPLAAAGGAGGQQVKGGGHATPRSWIADAHHELYVARREQPHVIRNRSALWQTS